MALEVMGWMWMRGADFARAIFGATPRRERAGDATPARDPSKRGPAGRGVPLVTGALD